MYNKKKEDVYLKNKFYYNYGEKIECLKLSPRLG